MKLRDWGYREKRNVPARGFPSSKQPWEQTAKEKALAVDDVGR